MLRQDVDPAKFRKAPFINRTPFKVSLNNNGLLVTTNHQQDAARLISTHETLSHQAYDGLFLTEYIPAHPDRMAVGPESPSPHLQNLGGKHLSYHYAYTSTAEMRYVRDHCTPRRSHYLKYTIMSVDVVGLNI